MKTPSICVLLSASALCAHAAIVSSYSAGVDPTAGTTGAADPLSQGWAASTGSPGSFNYGADSTNGGWRITDGTAGGAFFYQQSLSGSAVTEMTSFGWTATWTTAVNRDAVSSSGVPNGVNDYYNAGSNQNNNAFWLEVAGNYLYVLSFQSDADGDILISDGTNTFDITSGVDSLSDELGTGAPSVTYVTFTLSYDVGGGQASLSDSLGGNHGVVATSGSGSTNRIVFGATSSGGQGSTTWNSISVESIPEPSSLALLGAAGLLGLTRRRRK
ncbi:hypothetical protein Rhal01_02284 [Rubritalea halochordaticola]|uniref:Ice-binding protein C-terminal domain-containing protein n=1 Tax=Rubritalea halochordaticola TaxID=714537 RepID=A0ABP9V090_9BACT